MAHASPNAADSHWPTLAIWMFDGLHLLRARSQPGHFVISAAVARPHTHAGACLLSTASLQIILFQARRACSIAWFRLIPVAFKSSFPFNAPSFFSGLIGADLTLRVIHHPRRTLFPLTFSRPVHSAVCLLRMHCCPRISATTAVHFPAVGTHALLWCGTICWMLLSLTS